MTGVMATITSAAPYLTWLPVLAVGAPTIIGMAVSRRFRAWITKGMT